MWSDETSLAQRENAVRGNSKGNSHSISGSLRRNRLLTPMSWRWGDGSGPSSSRRLMGGLTQAVSMNASLRVLTLISIQCIFSCIMTAQAKSSMWLWKVFLRSLRRDLGVAHCSSFFLGLPHWTHGLPCDKYPSWPPLLPYPLLPSNLPKPALARTATWVASEENGFICFLRAAQA